MAKTSARPFVASIMSRLIIWSIVAASLLYSGIAVAKEIEFSQSSFTKLKSSYQGENWTLVLWSVDCPPCFKELALIQKMRKSHQDLNIVVVNVDDYNQVKPQRSEVISQFALNDIDTYFFAEDSGAPNRYLIDPRWHGELPRSYFYDASGQAFGKSGLVKESELTHWLVAK